MAFVLDSCENQRLGQQRGKNRTALAVSEHAGDIQFTLGLLRTESSLAMLQ